MKDTLDDLPAWLSENRNWGRWGADDERGAVNLITPDKRREAVACVREGRSISLSRDLAVAPGLANPQPVQHFARWFLRPDGQGGGAGEYLGLHVHGYQGTHVDALCHAWGADGMYNGRRAEDALTPFGANWGGIDQWKDGLVTRGVLLDAARHRGAPFVEAGRPVTASELAEIEQAQGCPVRPGDALVIHSGREAFERAHPDWNPSADPHPGLHASTLRYFRARDAALLLWDLMDAQPLAAGWAASPHAALWSFGLALVDNCALETLAAACAETGRFEFMVIVAPLALRGGTGSPVNPLALL